jgi:hypothetical protein
MPSSSSLTRAVSYDRGQSIIQEVNSFGRMLGRRKVCTSESPQQGRCSRYRQLRLMRSISSRFRLELLASSFAFSMPCGVYLKTPGCASYSEPSAA